MSEKKFYVTTPIYYVTAKPHLGSLYSTILADVAARWHRMRGQKTFMLTGTDEHGQKIAEAALKAGKEPRPFVDQFIDSFKNTWKAYEIEYNHFVRTTDPTHIKAVQTWITTVQQNGDIYKGQYAGYYCTPCETYVAEKDIKEDSIALCPSCNRPTVVVSEECYFFRLSAYQDKLLAFYESNPHFITPVERYQEVLSFVKAGLKDLSISRTTLSWGVPFPGDEKHVCYVWADALNNYVSSVGYADPAREKEFHFWWPADLHVLGKDIVRFHAVYWPAFLMAANLELPRKLLVHGWIKVGEQKMSKSLGNVVDPQALLEAYGADQMRYYLVRHMAVTQDSPFSIADLEQRINTDLVHDFGNLVHRVITLAQKNGLETIACPAWGEQERELQGQVHQILEAVANDMSNFLFHRAYGHLWRLVHVANSYFHAQEPWKVAKSDKERFCTIISASLHMIRAVCLLVWPVMPSKIDAIFAALNIKVNTGHDYVAELLCDGWSNTFQVSTAVEHFFTKIEPNPEDSGTSLTTAEESSAVMNLEKVSLADFGKMHLVVGIITRIECMPKSDKLYILTVDCGSYGIRTICAGVRKSYAPEDLINQQGIFIMNLPPRNLMGVTSEGMMLMAKDDQGKLAFATVRGPIANGARLQ